MSEALVDPTLGSVDGAPVDVPALVLISGPEVVLAERALANTITEITRVVPQVEVVHLYAAGYSAGELVVQSSPSLFSEDKIVVVHDLDEAPEELLDDVQSYLTCPAEAVTLVVLHKSGNRGKRVVTALKDSGARVHQAGAIRTDKEKTNFVAQEFRRAGRKATQGAVRALIEALGADVRELAAGIAQLVADTDGTIDEKLVNRYHSGKVEATGFRVADAALAGHAGEALRLLRHALAVGVDPVAIVGVLASQLRQLVRVGGAGRGPREDVAREVGMAGWQVDKARRVLPGWDAEGLGRAIAAVAAADFEVKGGARDPVYAVERAVMSIVQARRG